MEFDNLDAAKEEFDAKFKGKTGLPWEKRNDEPKANKYTFVEKSYDDDDEEDESEQNGNGSTGPESEVSTAGCRGYAMKLTVISWTCPRRGSWS